MNYVELGVLLVKTPTTAEKFRLFSKINLIPRTPTFPTLYDECKTVSISDLKRWGYLHPNQWKSGTLTWSRNGNKTGSISIATNTHTESPYLELDYQCNGKPIKYRVPLVTIPSNLGKGMVWFFLCPNTGKQCRKLYLANTYFLHRSAFKGCLYEKQTYLHNNRKLFRTFEKAFGAEKHYEQIYSKGFKTHYNGKPTKRFLRLLRAINKSEELSEVELSNLVEMKR